MMLSDVMETTDVESRATRRASVDGWSVTQGRPADAQPDRARARRQSGRRIAMGGATRITPEPAQISRGDLGARACARLECNTVAAGAPSPRQGCARPRLRNRPLDAAQGAR